MITWEMIQPLIEEQNKLHLALQKVTIAIKSLQELCEHDWKDEGHDSHKDHYICKICGKTSSW